MECDRDLKWALHGDTTGGPSDITTTVSNRDRARTVFASQRTHSSRKTDQTNESVFTNSSRKTDQTNDRV